MLRQTVMRHLAYRTGLYEAFGSRSMCTGTTPSRVLEVQDDASFTKEMHEAASSGSVCVVDFTAKWCGPCKMIAPIYESYSQQYKLVKFLKVDIDATSLQRTVTDHEITGVPAFFFYKGGKRMDSFTGARPDLLLQLLKKHGGA